MELSLINKTMETAIAEFDLSEVREIYSEILAAQEEVGGTLVYRAKIPAGGGRSFDIDTGNEDTDTSVQKLVGVVIHSHKCNALFEEGTQGDPPICSSMDGLVGYNAANEEDCGCMDCPHNKFGTGKNGVGKACKNMIRLYMMVEGSPIPLVLSLPPTSMRGWQNFRLGVLGPRRLKPHEVVVELSLSAEQNKAGIKYSVVKPRLVGALSEKDKACAAFFASGFRPSVKMSAEDYNTEEKQNE